MPPDHDTGCFQHRGAATGIEFHPHNPSLVATVGEDGVMRCADTRIWERNAGAGSVGGSRGTGAAGAMSRSIQIGVGLTCVSFSSDVSPVLTRFVPQDGLPCVLPPRPPRWPAHVLSAEVVNSVLGGYIKRVREDFCAVNICVTLKVDKEEDSSESVVYVLTTVVKVFFFVATDLRRSPEKVRARWLLR